MSPLLEIILLAAIFSAAPILFALLPSRRAAHARRLLQRGALLVDVGTPAEFAADHLEGAVNVPADYVARRQAELGEHTRPIITYSRSHVHSAVAAQTLRGIGFHEVFNMGTLRGTTVARLVALRPEAPRSVEGEAPFDAVDEASRGSFPASDPPAWVGMNAGSVGRDPARGASDERS